MTTEMTEILDTFFEGDRDTLKDIIDEKLHRTVDGDREALAKIIGENDAVLVITTANPLSDETLLMSQRGVDLLLEGLADGVFVGVVENRLDMSAFQARERR